MRWLARFANGSTLRTWAQNEAMCTCFEADMCQSVNSYAEVVTRKDTTFCVKSSSELTL